MKESMECPQEQAESQYFLKKLMVMLRALEDGQSLVVDRIDGFQATSSVELGFENPPVAPCQETYVHALADFGTYVRFSFI